MREGEEGQERVREGGEGQGLVQAVSFEYLTDCGQCNGVYNSLFSDVLVSKVILAFASYNKYH